MSFLSLKHGISGQDPVKLSSRSCLSALYFSFPSLSSCLFSSDFCFYILNRNFTLDIHICT
ncbi:unnamed protein product [Meloidogyne enterolobii]|uniref:Uncharacterized protein n=1 Tax=Meloidogyne enterolobii TaxID=390850 RepID=A0ACB1B415_MELEN